jgi:hypothetical protein
MAVWGISDLKFVVILRSFLKASHLLLDAKGHLKVSLGDFGKFTGYSYVRKFNFNKNKIKLPYDNTIGDKYTGMMEKSISWRNLRKSKVMRF